MVAPLQATSIDSFCWQTEKSVENCPRGLLMIRDSMFFGCPQKLQKRNEMEMDQK